MNLAGWRVGIIGIIGIIGIGRVGVWAFGDCE